MLNFPMEPNPTRRPPETPPPPMGPDGWFWDNPWAVLVALGLGVFLLYAVWNLLNPFGSDGRHR